jgi:hypothetical protein
MHRATLAVALIAFVSVSGRQATAQPAAQDNDAGDGTIPSFLESRAHAAVMAAAHSYLPQDSVHQCPSLHPSQRTIRIFREITFGPNKIPNGGFWLESFPTAGCARQTTTNFWLAASKDGSMEAIAGVPGTSHVDPISQVRAARYGAQAVAISARCQSPILVDTKFEANNGTAGDTAVTAEWREKWTYSACGHDAAVRMRFTPGNKELGINVEGEATP